MEEYRTGPAIIDETVRVAKKYLEEHPEELKSLTEAMDDVKRVRIGSPIISVFLGWPESRVSYSLERLNLEKSGVEAGPGEAL